MSDRRRLPFDGTTALETLRGKVQAQHFVPGEAATVARFAAPLWHRPGDGMDKEVVHGEPITVIARQDDYCFVQCGTDGYVGYLEASTLGPPVTPTHRVTARSSHVYAEPDFRSRVLDGRSFNSLEAVTETEGRFALGGAGWLPLQHLTPLDEPPDDPAELALRFLHTPYVWGGSTGWGVDCSGLVQAALLACGRACPRDSDMQAAEVGAVLAPDEPLRRNDLVFWRGHVGIMVDGETLLHANAHHMRVACEPLAGAEARILDAEFGPVTVRRRP